MSALMAGQVICCIDGSDAATDAARIGDVLAQRLGLELALLHVAPPVTEPGISAAAGGQQRLAEAERQDAEALLERTAQELGLPASTERHVLFGEPAKSISHFCEQRSPEMVVLGSHGRSGLKAALLGSVSSAVAAHAQCVVVIVPPGAAQRTNFA
jgi:nucleotide-binding universal stress UspA family protein